MFDASAGFSLGLQKNFVIQAPKSTGFCTGVPTKGLSKLVN